eukprot:XP_001698802.1 predicted protein [Chlamydomonas reinhardtii]
MEHQAQSRSLQQALPLLLAASATAIVVGSGPPERSSQRCEYLAEMLLLPALEWTLLMPAGFGAPVPCPSGAAAGGVGAGREATEVERGSGDAGSSSCQPLLLPIQRLRLLLVMARGVLAGVCGASAAGNSVGSSSSSLTLASVLTPARLQPLLRRVCRRYISLGEGERLVAGGTLRPQELEAALGIAVSSGKGGRGQRRLALVVGYW